MNTQALSETVEGEPVACGYLRDSDPLIFAASAKLVGFGVKGEANWPQEHDHWSVTLHETLYGGEMTFDYRTGTGLRKNGRPEAPTTRDILICISSDLRTAEELPSDDGAAMDYLADELGMSGKPSEILASVRALRKNQEDAAAMLRNTGTDVGHFADWAASLDN